MKLTLWTYEGPPHIGAMRVATAMQGLHYVLHAPQGDTYADLLFTMIERRDARPPVTYTTFQARDLGSDTAELFKTAVRDAAERFQPQAILVGASCTAELLQDDPGGLAAGLRLSVPVIPLELPAYQRRENWGAAETFYRVVRALTPASASLAPRAPDTPPRCNILGPTALGFRHRDDVEEVKVLLGTLGIGINVVAPLGATPADIARLPDADFNVDLYPETSRPAVDYLRRAFGQPSTRTVPIGVGATRDFVVEVARLAGVDPAPALSGAASRLPWYSRSVDSTYLTGKRVFVFGDATHAIAAARIASEEMGFSVVGLGTYSREFARDVRAAAERYGVQALVTDDYLEVESRIAELQPELVLGSQMERHIAKRLGIACAVISAPVHVQDFPARYSPQMGFEGANVIFDTWVHPLMMGLEEHLLGMFRGDAEFHDDAAPSHLGHAAAGHPRPSSVAAPAAPAAPGPGAPPARANAAGEPGWAAEAEQELKKSPSSCAERHVATPRVLRASAGWPSSPSRRSTMRKPISAVENVPVRIVIVTMDTHLASAAERASRTLVRDLPGLNIALHAASEWADDPAALERCRADIAAGDVILATMLFMEDHFRPVLEALRARRDECDAMVCAMSAGEVVRLTRLGRLSMDGSQGGPLALLRRLRGRSDGGQGTGARQLKMLRRLPQILRFIPGTAQDLRAYFLTLQYWLAGSDDNIANMIRLLVERYADGPRRGLRGALKPGAPVAYPETGLYHPRMPGRIGIRPEMLPNAPHNGTIGLLVMRSYVLAGNTAHYDGVIAALEARGLRVVPAFAAGLDARPAIEAFFLRDGIPAVDALVSLTGFSLVGGPAYNDSKAAEEILTRLDVPYVAAQPLELQSLEQWQESERGLSPVEATIMVAIPELDGATGPIVFGGRSALAGGSDRDMRLHPERAGMLADRVARLVALRRKARAERRVAIVLFNFPPNAGNVGTAAYLSVFASLHNTLRGLAAAGYAVELPESVDALRERILSGNASRFGAPANVHVRIGAEEYVRRERHLREIEAQWGPAPGRHQSDGSSIFVIGERFGNVFIGVQPAFGYEGDPMRLLFEKGFAPTHAFAAFYRWMREDFHADAVLHFGTHGALEFMPGKQAGLSAACWSDRLIGDLPNIYLYAANNPSEGTIARRRAAATLVSYLTPPVAQAGLYRGLLDLKASIERWRVLPSQNGAEAAAIAELVQAQAASVDLAPGEPVWGDAAAAEIARLGERILELEYALIPHGLHVVGQSATPAERADLLQAIAGSSHALDLPRHAAEALAAGASPEAALARLPADERDPAVLLAALRALHATARLLAEDHEVPAILRALDGRFVPPAPGGDLLRNTAILPTGRNLHGFDPFRIPSAFAVADGARQAERILARHTADGRALPESVALVLWGTDNLKSEGGPIAQALALMGARPRFDTYGRLAGASLVPLDELGRPRIDVVVSLSGIFRDLLPLQTKLLAEAAYLAAAADEPAERNFVRRHALAYQARHGCDLETAALRVFGNADGAYGSNVNHMVENGAWDDEDELAETYTRRKSFAYGRSGRPVQQAALLRSALADVDLAYQNLDSIELGVTTVDQYFDTLGGISRAVSRARGGSAPSVYIGDQTRGEGVVRTLSEQVALETRTRMLNPKWYEGMLNHGYEGVRQIEEHVRNTMGWSATTGQVQPWVYQQLTETYVLDPAMRERLASLNPTASAKVANRLIEAHARGYWSPDEAVLDALQRAGEELEDRLEGITAEAAA